MTMTQDHWDHHQHCQQPHTEGLQGGAAGDPSETGAARTLGRFENLEIAQAHYALGHLGCDAPCSHAPPANQARLEVVAGASR
jgi:hypothetical protein